MQTVPARSFVSLVGTNTEEDKTDKTRKNKSNAKYVKKPPPLCTAPNRSVIPTELPHSVQLQTKVIPTELPHSAQFQTETQQA